MKSKMYGNTYPKKRYNKTLSFLKEVIPEHSHILDLGVRNPFSDIMSNAGFIINNTKGEDLDLDFTSVQNTNTDVVTAFEIFEHLVAPFNVLKSIHANHLVASVPLRLWFASAYRSSTDKWDRHFHEFEDWQFDWLLEKAGWEIIKKEKFANPVSKLGFRPLLRYFTPRYYLVYAKRL